MGDKTGIQWTDATWNCLRGCTRKSAGCTRCYAESIAHRFSGPGQPYEGLTTNGRWNGQVRFIDDHWTDPVRWARPRRIFVNSMSDIFHESVPIEWIDRIFGVMALAGHHTYQCLTKRSERMLEYCQQDRRVQWAYAAARATTCGDIGFDLITLGPKVLPNVWLGVSIENQDARARIVDLALTPAAVRFVSAEPLIGPLDLGLRRPHGSFADSSGRPLVDWVIIGGESGGQARECNVGDIRRIILECEEAGVACFVKQLGKLPMSTGVRLPLKDSRHGGDIDEWPEDLRVRQFPRVQA